jgi:LAO/AO transport system kinase
VPLAEGVLAGDRRSLARALTLVESTKPDHRRRAAELLDELLPSTGKAIRIAVSGGPGAGKSTLLEGLGLQLCEAGHRVAVLAVDPSSRRTGGSILGDKTRMVELSKHPAAFIRPSPAGRQLGGVARRTREATLVCEAAGYDIVVVETVGVGQSEVAAADLVDCFVVLVPPGGGDDLQGVKRGVMELADVVVVTKSDGDLHAAARRAVADHRAALSLLRPRWPAWQVPVVAVSALEGRGLDELWSAIESHRRTLEADGSLQALRRAQREAWFEEELHAQLVERMTADPQFADRHDAQLAAVADGLVSPPRAVAALLDGGDGD